MGKVLLVDDSEIIRTQVTDILSDAGCEVIQAFDGDQGLKVAKEKSAEIDAVITDYTMPGLNGVELVESLKAMTSYEGKGMIMLTTEAGAELKKKGNAIGVRAWLVKPVNGDLLLKVLNKLIVKAQAA